ncbi:MAG: PDZ domain-containing protein [Pirellulaceae bacterium]
MVLSRWNSLAALALASAGLSGLAASGDEQVSRPEQVLVIRELRAAEEGELVPAEFEGQPLFAFVGEGAGDEVSPYWIGVQLEPPTDILKQHLKLDGGMVAVHVFEGSPAEKSGLKANDIILKAGDIDVKEPGDLLKSVGAAQGNEITLVVLCRGKETTIKVTPAKRPQEDNAQAVHEAEAEQREAVRKLEAALNLYKKKAALGGEAPAVDVVRVRPGVVAGYAETPTDLPKDVTVTITKEGTKPAKIIIKKDGKEFEATEDKLGQLPVEIRGYAHTARASGGTAHAYKAYLAAPHGAMAETPKGPHTLLKAVTTQAVPPPATTESAKVYRYQVEAKHGEEGVDSKLDQILKLVSQKEDRAISDLQKEVQQLRKELEDLRKEKK